MKRIFASFALLVLLGAGCSETDASTSSRINGYSSDVYDDADNYDYGYEFAEDNDIDNFDDCQDELGTGDAEDGCNDYVRDNYSGYQNFGDYGCTEDCSGHEAGYEWASNNGIYDQDDCSGNSQSFIEGCWQYVEDNQ